MVKEIVQPPAGEPERRIEALEKTLGSVREDSEVAHVLLGLSAALGEVRTVQETLEKAVRMVPELCGADRCFAVSLDEATTSFVIRSHYGFDPDSERKLFELAKEQSNFPLINESLEAKTPILVPDTLDDPRMSPELVETRSLGALIVLPLVRWGDDFGGLGVEFEQARRFGPKDAALARGIARQVGVALANARRFNLLQELRSFGLQMGSELRLSGVLSGTVKAALDLLGGDAACVYFLDAQRGTLVASESRGLPEDRMDVYGTIDLGEDPWDGLLRSETVTVDLLERGATVPGGPSCTILAPIPAPEDSILGALAVFWSGTMNLGSDEIEALNVMAAQSASSIANAQRFERQRRVARSLQAGLLSTEMPAMGSFRIGAIYEAASSESDVGGDFFDVFELNGDRIAIVVGDVSGKGAEAAAQTAMAKYMLRAFAMRNPAPSSVLFHLNNALVQGLPEDRFTTALYGVVDPESREISMAVGGHPPALVYRSASSTIEVVEAEGSIIGAFQDQQFESAAVNLESGDTLMAYTDGLSEARRDDELYGRGRIIESFARHVHQNDPEEVARRVYREAADFGEVWDDTVVFVLTCSPE
ncbi:MAG: SpoIIE family protein phosphatase [Actinomycetota bacterium]|nr:SpoIIE family protein phosphatase [Actinomycetota bacterium]